MTVVLSTYLSKRLLSLLFFFNDTATTEIYTISLHDALPILFPTLAVMEQFGSVAGEQTSGAVSTSEDRKSTRLNSSNITISYAAFCLKKKLEKRKFLSFSSNRKGDYTQPLRQ